MAGHGEWSAEIKPFGHGEEGKGYVFVDVAVRVSSESIGGMKLQL
jgi:hypothetical protein